MLLKKDKNGGWSYRREGEGVVYRRVGGEGEGVKPGAHTMPLGFQTSFVR